MNDFINHFETKVKQFTDEKRSLDEAECLKLGKKDAESYPFSAYTYIRTYVRTYVHTYIQFWL